MTTNTFTFSPMYRHAHTALCRSQAQKNDYPHYNITQISAENYQVTLALPGFSLAEIDITQTANELVVSGKKVSDDSKAQQYLHQGINQADFSRKFMLAEHVEVTDAQMEQGLLTINLHREVPATQQPRKISIGQAA